MSTRSRAPSPCDASLSDQGTCPAAGLDSGIGEPPAGDGLGACAGRCRRRGGGRRVDGARDSPRRAAGPDRTGRRGEAGSDTARRARADTPRATRASMPPISGHGARSVVNVVSSARHGAPEGPGLPPSGLRLFRRARSTSSRRGGPRSPLVNGEGGRSARGCLHRSGAGFEDHRQAERRACTRAATRSKGIKDISASKRSTKASRRARCEASTARCTPCRSSLSTVIREVDHPAFRRRWFA
jgi:hypothetical protein